MSFEFVLAIIFTLLTIGAFVFHRSVKKSLPALQAKTDESNRSYNRDAEERLREAKSMVNGTKNLVLGLLVITGVFTFFASAYTVPVRNVGIVTSFNRPTGDTTGSGLKFVWPWQRVADFDASLITENNIGTWGKGCTTVRIGSLATACVENRIQWRVKESAAPKLYTDYKGDFDNLRNNFIRNQIQLAINAVFATYNPLSQVNLKTGQVNFDGAKLSSDLKEELVRYMGTDIEVVTASVPLVHHDPQTEGNIKQFQDVVAQARILEQREQNAIKEKIVSDLQRQFLSTEYLQNKCIEESVKMNYAPGLCLLDSGIVNAPTTK